MATNPRIPHGFFKIMRFEGMWDFLSNFYPAPVTLDGQLYPSVEHAYQAAKVEPLQRDYFLTCTAGQAKRKNKGVALPAQWHSTKLTLMAMLVEQKFTYPDLRAKLITTQQAELFEGNWWGDKFWGVDSLTGEGNNHLGKILMKIRTRLQNEALWETFGVAQKD